MTLRERWMLAGLAAAFLGLAALGIWNQARYQDVQDAVRRYVSLDERQEKDSAETTALLRQARPEIRRNLSRGEFEAALKRLKALDEEDAGSSGAATDAKALAINQLWPSGSPDRARLKSVLNDLVQKQREGFDVSPAQQKLVEVAKAAREGKRDEAVAAFNQAADLVRDAPLRPGFKPKVTLAAAVATITPAELQVMEQTMQQLRTLRATIPAAIARTQMTPPQRRAMEAAVVLFDEMLAAYEQKRDLRPVISVLDPLKKAFDRAGKTQQWGAVEDQIQEVRKALKSLPMLPPLSAATPGQPPPPSPNPAPVPALPPASSPASAPAPAPPGGIAGILQVLDFIRALPEDKYQGEKAKIGTGIAQLLAAASKGKDVGEPVGKDLQLALSTQGEFQALRLFGEAVPALGTGGVSVQIDGQKVELPIRGPLTREGEAHRFRVDNPQGAVTVTIKAGQGDLTLKVSGRRATAGPPAFLNLAIPAQLGGWYWQQGAEAQTIAVDREYRIQSASGKLPRLIVRNGTAELTMDAPSGSDAGYRSKDGRLWVRLPLTVAAGVAEHTVHLTATRMTP